MIEFNTNYVIVPFKKCYQKYDDNNPKWEKIFT